jgi:hypothetical protein
VDETTNLDQEWWGDLPLKNDDPLESEEAMQNFIRSKLAISEEGVIKMFTVLLAKDPDRKGGLERRDAVPENPSLEATQDEIVQDHDGRSLKRKRSICADLGNSPNEVPLKSLFARRENHKRSQTRGPKCVDFAPRRPQREPVPAQPNHLQELFSQLTVQEPAPDADSRGAQNKTT